MEINSFNYLLPLFDAIEDYEKKENSSSKCMALKKIQECANETIDYLYSKKPFHSEFKSEVDNSEMDKIVRRLATINLETARALKEAFMGFKIIQNTDCLPTSTKKRPLPHSFGFSQDLRIFEKTEKPLKICRTGDRLAFNDCSKTNDQDCNEKDLPKFVIPEISDHPRPVLPSTFSNQQNLTSQNSLNTQHTFIESQPSGRTYASDPDYVLDWDEKSSRMIQIPLGELTGKISSNSSSFNLLSPEEIILKFFSVNEKGIPEEFVQIGHNIFLNCEAIYQSYLITGEIDVFQGWEEDLIKELSSVNSKERKEILGGYLEELMTIRGDESLIDGMNEWINLCLTPLDNGEQENLPPIVEETSQPHEPFDYSKSETPENLKKELKGLASSCVGGDLALLLDMINSVSKREILIHLRDVLRCREKDNIMSFEEFIEIVYQ
jgi:hypothetical protein